jgi:TPR repeat protein
MRRRRYSRVLPVFFGVLTLVSVFLYVESQRRAHHLPAVTNRERIVPRPIVATAVVSRPESSSDVDPRIDKPPQSFSHRLRCISYHRGFGHLLAPETLLLLCDRKPLEALKIMSSMAETGDEHARIALALLGNFGSCDALQPSPTFPRFSVVTMERARQNGATSDTLQRLSGVLSEEQAGPTVDELEACRLSASEYKKLWPAMVEQFVSSLGRSLKTLLGENEADVQIEHDRKSLVSGDADSQLQLAQDLLKKGTPNSQGEALTLLREAASASPSAKTELAECLLKGCPTPAPDTSEATQLLTDAALSGDPLALRMMSGTVGPQFFDAELIVPASERYAWSKFLQRLNEEGCFGTSEYLTWVNFPNRQPGLLEMSPYESTAAEARAAELLATQLDRTRELLGCDST